MGVGETYDSMSNTRIVPSAHQNYEQRGDLLCTHESWVWGKGTKWQTQVSHGLEELIKKGRMTKTMKVKLNGKCLPLLKERFRDWY